MLRSVMYFVLVSVVAATGEDNGTESEIFQKVKFIEPESEIFQKVKFIEPATNLYKTLANLNKSLTNWSLLRITPKAKSQEQWLKSQRLDPSLDFWSPCEVMRDTYVRVYNERQPSFISTLELQNFDWELITSDLYSVVEEERALQEVAERLHSQSEMGTMRFDRYLRYVEMVYSMQALSARYPRITAVQRIGYSFEGRPIPVFVIGDMSGHRYNPLIIIEAGCHAREWISSATALFIIRELLENPKYKNIVTKVDWHIIPLLNPDGYEYSRTDNRFWQKSRRNYTCPYNNDSYQGVNIDRNFDFHWNEMGASDSPCDDTYAGPEPFSEPEARALRDVVLANRERIKIFLSLHSFGRHILYPWSYTERSLDNWQILAELANYANIALRNHNTEVFRMGSAGDFLSTASGTSTDWVRGIVGVEYVYSIQLPGGGKSGKFDPPNPDILPYVTNFFPAILAFAEFAARPVEDSWSRGSVAASAVTAVPCCALVAVLVPLQLL